MQTIDGPKEPEARLQRSIIDQQDDIWGSLLQQLDRTVGQMRVDPDTMTSSHRLADFHRFGSVAAPILGIGQDFETAIERLEEMQLGILGQGDDHVDLLASWVESGLASGDQRTLTTAELLEELRGTHKGPDRHFPFRSTSALGTWLGRHKDLIRLNLGVAVQPSFEGHSRAWLFRKLTCDGVDTINGSGYQRVSPNHTFTPSLCESPEGDVAAEGVFNLDD